MPLKQKIKYFVDKIKNSTDTSKGTKDTNRITRPVDATNTTSWSSWIPGLWLVSSCWEYAFLAYIDGWEFIASWGYYLIPTRFWNLLWGPDLELLDPIDQKVLIQQETEKARRFEIRREQSARQAILRQNHNADITRIERKRQICENWYMAEKEDLDANNNYLQSVRLPLHADPETVLDWKTEEGVSYYKGTDELCKKLQCSNPDVTKKPVLGTIQPQSSLESTKLNTLHAQFRASEEMQFNEDRLRMMQENVELRAIVEDLQHQSNIRILKSASIAPGVPEPTPGPTPVPTPVQDGVPDEMLDVMTTDAELFLTGLTKIMLFPANFLDQDSSIWKKANIKPPKIFGRWIIAGFGSLVWYFWLYYSITVLYEIFRYGLRALPDPKIKFKFKPDYDDYDDDDEKMQKYRRNERNRHITGSIRGGAMTKPAYLTYAERSVILRSVDPVFVLIHLEKLKQSFNLKRVSTKPRLQIKKRLKKFINKLKELKIPKKQFFYYLMLALLTIERAGEINNIRRIHDTVISDQQSTQRIYSLEDIYGMKKTIHDKKTNIIITPVTEKINCIQEELEDSKTEKSTIVSNQSKSTKNKPARLKSGKVVKFSDLPPLPESQFDEILTDNNQVRNKASSQIRIRTQN